MPLAVDTAVVARTIAIESVDPGCSVGWWADGAALFVRSPLRWTALAAVLMVPLALLALLPAVGGYAAALFSPLAVGTWMLAADPVHRSGSGDALRLRALWPRLRRGAHLAPLLVLGAGLAVAMLGMDLVSRALGVAHVLGPLPIDAPADPAARAVLGNGMLVLLLLLTFSLVVSAALWFAPALVVLHGARPRAAVMSSLRAVRDNALTFLLFAVVQLLISAAVVGLHEVAWLVLLPVMLHAGYVSYRDVFA